MTARQDLPAPLLNALERAEQALEALHSGWPKTGLMDVSSAAPLWQDDLSALSRDWSMALARALAWLDQVPLTLMDASKAGSSRDIKAYTLLSQNLETLLRDATSGQPSRALFSRQAPTSVETRLTDLLMTKQGLEDASAVRLRQVRSAVSLGDDTQQLMGLVMDTLPLLRAYLEEVEAAEKFKAHTSMAERSASQILLRKLSRAGSALDLVERRIEAELSEASQATKESLDGVVRQEEEAHLRLSTLAAKITRAIAGNQAQASAEQQSQALAAVAPSGKVEKQGAPQQAIALIPSHAAEKSKGGLARVFSWMVPVKRDSNHQSAEVPRHTRKELEELIRRAFRYSASSAWEDLHRFIKEDASLNANSQIKKVPVLQIFLEVLFDDKEFFVDDKISPRDALVFHHAKTRTAITNTALTLFERAADLSQATPKPIQDKIHLLGHWAVHLGDIDGWRVWQAGLPEGEKGSDYGVSICQQLFQFDLGQGKAREENAKLIADVLNKMVIPRHFYDADKAAETKGVSSGFYENSFRFIFPHLSPALQSATMECHIGQLSQRRGPTDFEIQEFSRIAPERRGHVVGRILKSDAHENIKNYWATQLLSNQDAEVAVSAKPTAHTQWAFALWEWHNLAHKKKGGFPHQLLDLALLTKNSNFLGSIKHHYPEGPSEAHTPVINRGNAFSVLMDMQRHVQQKDLAADASYWCQKVFTNEINHTTARANQHAIEKDSKENPGIHMPDHIIQMTPLMQACEGKKYEWIGALLAAGAEPVFQSTSGITAAKILNSAIERDALAHTGLARIANAGQAAKEDFVRSITHAMRTTGFWEAMGALPAGMEDDVLVAALTQEPEFSDAQKRKLASVGMPEHGIKARQGAIVDRLWVMDRERFASLAARAIGEIKKSDREEAMAKFVGYAEAGSLVAHTREDRERMQEEIEREWGRIRMENKPVLLDIAAMREARQLEKEIDRQIDRQIRRGPHR